MPTNPALRQAAALIRALKLDVEFDPANPTADDYAALQEVEAAARRAIVAARVALVDQLTAEKGSLALAAAELGVSKQYLSRMVTAERKREEEAGETT
ncbi:hypothetical protein DMC64_41875 [Amycolatopsis sp. WAC 04197]|uniref:hypothetical protein n=1 Tax=Amycolatopsis sp. WAC 04197 TaxID=2203199 RepID=UPI000F790761|nr:hypothetical protein [Amycolatopsis sp. WAC 04197]RSN38618.1 hypothetical protein DMC64_41875 [Amycolatopsis sp. WAC 04197]